MFRLRLGTHDLFYTSITHQGPVMPDHVSPGVYVEESGQPHSIQGLPTSTAGFVGPTHSGPLFLPSAPSPASRVRANLRRTAAHAVRRCLAHAQFHVARRASLLRERRHSPVCLPVSLLGQDQIPMADAPPRRLRGCLDPATNCKTALMAFEEVDEISTIAAPAPPSLPDNSADARSILNLLIVHAQQMRYRIAVLDSGDASVPMRYRPFAPTSTPAMPLCTIPG